MAVSSNALDIDDGFDLEGEYSGHGESSDPDYDPTSKSEELLLVVHDRMIRGACR